MVAQPATTERTTSNNSRVSDLLAALELMQRDEQPSCPPDADSVASPISPQREVGYWTVLQRDTVGTDDSEDDLDVDLAKAALNEGTAAFNAREWEEAVALLQEALQTLQQLPVQQRTFCDTFALRYRLAVCAYYAQGPADAEQALISVVQQPVKSSEHQEYVYDVAYLLSHLYIRSNQLERARLECERALQGRRRLLGKHSEAALVCTALMAHIYFLLNNRARAKVCLAIIPEARRDEIRTLVEATLGTTLEQRDSSSSLETRSLCEDVDFARHSFQSTFPEYTRSLSMEQRCYGPVSHRISQWQPVSPQHSYRSSQSDQTPLESRVSVTATSLSSAEERSGLRSKQAATGQKDYSEDTGANHEIGSMGARKPAMTKATSKSSGLSRAEILRNLRCAPVDPIEEAVVNGDLPGLTSLLQKRKKSGFLRSKVQKALHSKRVGALHFAALFGEVEMARRLLASNFDINEVPELSTTCLTPLKFAVGARQVDMAAFLVANGAKPIEPDSWSTLAGQLMNRSWLRNTMSVLEREDLNQAPDSIIAILKIWLKHGWDVNVPFDASGRTLLHQAVAFESGSYKWDSNVRAAVTRFLCEQGAYPLISDTKGNKPYDMAVVVDDQELLGLLEQRLNKKDSYEKASALVELSAGPVIIPAGTPSSPVELGRELFNPIELSDTSVKACKLSVRDYG